MSINLLNSLWLVRTTRGHGMHPILFGGSFHPTEANRANCRQTNGFESRSYDLLSHIEEIPHVSSRHTHVNDVGLAVDTERGDFHG
jgi:hypothetical protein